MCHPFLMMNGPSAPTGPHSAPAYVAQHPHQQTAPQPPPPPPPTQAAAPHYITQPMLPNLGLFRSGVQVSTKANFDHFQATADCYEERSF